MAVSPLEGWTYLGWGSLADAPEQVFGLVQKGKQSQGSA
jgi:hypothetical protein